MLYTIFGILARICSNSYINVSQKILTSKGVHSSCVNFYTYFGLTILCLLMLPFVKLTFSAELLKNSLIMGILGALGNYYIIKALSLGELSALAPINSYKPVVALVVAFLYLHEIPSILSILGIVLIIIGTYFIFSPKKSCSYKAVAYRILALIFSASEAIFIKKIILLSNVPESFILWAITGFIFSTILAAKKCIISAKPQLKYQLSLVALVAIMQYSTNFVFSRINIACALSLFQLSTILSVYLGANIFNEKGLKRKLIASMIMVIGAIIIIIS